MQVTESLDVALAAAGDTIAQPMFFVDDLAVQLVLLALFFGQHVVAPGLEGGKAAVDLPDLAAIEPGGRARQIGEEAAVVGGGDKRGGGGFWARPPPPPWGGGPEGWGARP